MPRCFSRAESQLVERAEGAETAGVDGGIVDPVERGGVLLGRGEGGGRREARWQAVGSIVGRHGIEASDLVSEDGGPEREAELDRAPVVRQGDAKLGAAAAAVVVAVERDRAEGVRERAALGRRIGEEAGEVERHVRPVPHGAVVRRVEVDHPSVRVHDGFDDAARPLDDEVVRSGRSTPTPERRSSPRARAYGPASR